MRTLHNLTRVLVAVGAWWLMTPYGPIIHEHYPVAFDTEADCRETADWLNAEAARQRGAPVAWYWCEEH